MPNQHITEDQTIIEAVERHIAEGSTISHERAWWFAERAVAAAAPLIRAQVAEEIAQALETKADAVDPELSDDWIVLRHAAQIARRYSRVAQPEPASAAVVAAAILTPDADA